MTRTDNPILRYVLHGCVLESRFPIPDLAPVMDPTISLRTVAITRTDAFWQGDETAYTPWRPDDVLPQNPALRMQYWKGAEGYLIRFAGYADYLVGLDGKSILVYMDAADLSELVRDVLVGPILATALLIQGAYALHGSSVARQGSAIAFIGNNGAGKSTLATSYVSKDWELLTDGMFVASIEDGRAWIHPGDPRIRVRGDAAGRLEGLPALGDGLQQGRAKHRLAVGEGAWGRFAQEPQALRVAYFLQADAPEAGVVIEPCKGADAIMTTMTNTYGVQTYQTEFLGPHLKYVEQFLRAVPIRRLRYTKELRYLGQMIEAIKTDAAQFIPEQE